MCCRVLCDSLQDLQKIHEAHLHTSRDLARRASEGLWKHLSHDMTKPTKWLCEQRRLRAAWAFAQSEQSLRCALKGQLRTQGFFMRTAKTLIRLGAHSVCWFCHVAAHFLTSVDWCADECVRCIVANYLLLLSLQRGTYRHKRDVFLGGILWLSVYSNYANANKEFKIPKWKRSRICCF